MIADGTKRLCIGLGCLFLWAAHAAGAAPEKVVLSRGGQALMPVVTAADADAEVKAHGQSLAAQLGRITGATFTVTDQSATPSIRLEVADIGDATPAGRERYLLKTSKDGVLIRGRTPLAVQHAVWDLLHRFGYRQFFPGANWEVVPQEPNLTVAVDTVEEPDYLVRRIWYGFGTWDYNAEPYRQWCIRNRAVSVFELNSGHCYDQIIRLHKGVFDEHPEYYALVNGERKGSKMCIANPAVPELVVEYARDFFKRRPNADSVSVEPSDGGGWCECEACAKLGTATDRALLLANRVCEMLDKEYPDRFAALYAYSYHSPPPTVVKPHPRLIINVATSFLRGGYSATELLEAWQKAGAQQAGIREYYSVSTWDRDLPGRSRGSNLDYLRRTIPDFHRLGARFMSSESSDNWGCNGLGYYLAQRMLWDVGEAERVQTLRQDFLDKCFGAAAPVMDEFYQRIDGSQRQILASPQIGRLYDLLQQARTTSKDDAVLRRLNDLALYVRYVELFLAYTDATGADRFPAFEQVIRHVYRMRTTMMVHAKALYRDVPGRDKAMKAKMPADAAWQVAEGKNPWKSSEPWTDEQIAQVVARGIEANPPLSFEPVGFGEELVPATRLGLTPVNPLEDSNRSRGRMTYLTWVDKAPATLELRVTGGLIAHYRDRGPAEVILHGPEEDDLAMLAKGQTAPDGVERTIQLATPNPGLHRVTVSDGSDMTSVIFPKGWARTVPLTLDSGVRLSGRQAGYFYVPKGTRTVGGHITDASGIIHDGDGNPMQRLDKVGYFAVDVAPGQDGKLWSYRNVSGRIVLMTVPPYSAQSLEELLLPREVVEKDARR